MSQFNRLAVLIVAILIMGSLMILPSADAGGREGGGGRGSGTGAYFFGMLHQPLGGSGLALDPVGRLVVSNIGSSGNDGVSIDLSQPAPAGGVTPGWAGVFNFGAPNPAAASTSFTIQARDQFNNPVSSMHITETIDAGGGLGQTSVGLGALLAFPPSSVTVITRLHGTVVQQQEYLPPYPPVLASGALGFNGGSGIEVRAVREKHFVNQFDVDICEDVVRITAPTPISLTGGLPPENADELVVRLNGLPPGTRYIGNLAITASDFESITVRNEGLLKGSSSGKVKFFNEAKGFGYITGGGDVDGDGYPDIVVSNIGSSGNDGVSLHRFRASSPGTIENTLSAMSTEVDWGDAGDLPQGSVMRFVVDAEGPVINEFELVVTEVGGGSAAVSVVACDHPDCCTSPPCAGVVVEALRHGVLVDRVVHDATPSTIAVGNIGSSGNDGVQFSAALIESCLNIAEDRYLLGLREYDATAMTLTGSAIGPVIANELRVSAHRGDVGAIRAGILQMASAGGPGTPPGSFTILDCGARSAFVPHLTYGGLPHMAKGGPNILVSGPVGGPYILHVSGRGDWDNDGDDIPGVAIQLGEADGWAGEVDFGQAGALTTGLRWSTGYAFMIGGAQLEVAEVNGGDAALSFVQDVCAPCSTRVELFNGNVVVGQVTVASDFTGALVTGALGTSSTGQMPRLMLGSGRNPTSTSDKVVVDWVTIDTPMTLPGQPTVIADRVLITIVPVQPGDELDLSIIEIAVGSEGVPDVDFRIGDERVLNDYDIADSFCPIGHQAQGQATMCASRDNHLQGGVDVIQSMHVSNIGSSGNDGVTLTSLSVSNLIVSIGIAFDDQAMPPVSSKAITTKGTGAIALAGSAAFETTLNLQRNGGDIVIHGDMSSIGSTTHTVEIYNDGALVSSRPGVGTVVATVPASSPVAGAKSEIKFSQPFGKELGLSLSWAIDVPISVPGQPPIMGDALRVKGDNPTMQVAAFESMSITGQDLGSFTITDETIVPLNTCPADCAPVGHPDGTVNVTDLLAVISNWGPCLAPPACPADTNGDNAVNVTDLLAVISAWGSCP